MLFYPVSDCHLFLLPMITETLRNSPPARYKEIQVTYCTMYQMEKKSNEIIDYTVNSVLDTEETPQITNLLIYWTRWLNHQSAGLPVPETYKIYT